MVHGDPSLLPAKASCAFYLLLQLDWVNILNMRLLMQSEKNQSVQVIAWMNARTVCACSQLLYHTLLCSDVSSLGAIKKVLPDNFTYGEIKMTVAVLMVTTGFVRPQKCTAKSIVSSNLASWYVCLCTAIVHIQWNLRPQLQSPMPARPQN